MLTAPINRFLSDMFPDVLLAKPILTRDGRGKALTYGTQISVPCKIKKQQMFSFKADGKEYVSTAHAKVNGNYGLTLDFEYTLPSRFKPQTPTPVHVDTPTDENGPHHQTVYFQ